MRLAWNAVVAALLAGAATTHAKAETPAETAAESLPDAIVDALADNPDIQIALARRDDAKYGVSEARAAFFPRVDVTAGAGPELNDPYVGQSTRRERLEASVTLRQTIWDFGLTGNDVRRAKAAYASTDWSARERIEAIALEITAAYLGVLERQRLVDLARSNIDAHAKILRMVETQRELGLTTGADVSRVQARLNNVEAELLDRESALQQAREAYRRLVKHLPGRVVDVPAPDAALPADAEAAAALAGERNPRLMQAQMERKSLDRQLASHKGNLFPQIGLELQGNWKEDVLGDTNRNQDMRAMVMMRYNLFNGGADVAVSKRIAARLREADFQVERLRREVDQDIRNDFTALKAARAKVATIDAEATAAQRVVDLYVEQFKAGKRTAFDLLDSQQAAFAARASRITNDTQQVLQGFRVLQKLGLLFSHVTGQDPTLRLTH